MKKIVAGVTVNLLAQIAFLSAAAPWLIGAARTNRGILSFAPFLCYSGALLGLASLIILGIAWALVKIRPSFARAAVAGLEALLWIFLLLDSAVFARLGVHLDNPLVVGAFQLRDFNFGIKLGGLRTALLMLAVCVCFISQIAVFHHLPRKALFSKWIEAVRWNLVLQRVALYSCVAAVAFCLIRFSASEGVVPVDSLLLRTTLLEAAHDKLQPVPAYPVESYSWRMAKKPDIVMILSDAFRYDAVNANDTPNLNAFLAEENCVPQGRHYAGSHLTRNGVFSFLYGLDSYYYTAFIHGGVRSLPLKILKDNGYRLGLFDSSGISSYSPPIVKREEFDVYREFIQEGDRALSDRASIAGAIAQMKDPGAPLFQFIFLYSTHEPYFTDTETRTLASHPLKDFAPSEFDAVRGQYMKSVRYVDKLMGPLLAQMRPKIRSGDAILVFSSDHGEEFGEGGYHGHVHFSANDTLLRVPLVLCGKGLPTDRNRLSVHADIWPTLFDLNGGEGSDHSKSVSWLSGRSFLAPEGRARALITEPYFLSYQLGLVLATQERKYLFRTTDASLSEIELKSIQDSLGQTVPIAAKEEAIFQSELRAAKSSYGKYFRVFH